MIPTEASAAGKFWFLRSSPFLPRKFLGLGATKSCTCVHEDSSSRQKGDVPLHPTIFFHFLKEPFKLTFTFSLHTSLIRWKRKTSLPTTSVCPIVRPNRGALWSRFYASLDDMRDPSHFNLDPRTVIPSTSLDVLSSHLDSTHLNTHIDPYSQRYYVAQGNLNTINPSRMDQQNYMVPQMVFPVRSLWQLAHVFHFDAPDVLQSAPPLPDRWGRAYLRQRQAVPAHPEEKTGETEVWSGTREGR